MNVAIVGATGYGGLQLVSLLRRSKKHKITFLGGERSAGLKWNNLYPFLTIDNNPLIESLSIDAISQSSDVAILSLPNGISSTITPSLIKKGLKVIDLSADYRYKSLELWKEVYSEEASIYERNDHELCQEAVYGLTEIYKKEISKARLIASPGCDPTSSLLPLIPFLSQGIIENEGIIIDSKSGTSGGGRNPKVNLLFAESGEGISAYSIFNHRHVSEIEQILSQVSDNKITLQFTPHLVPMVRGMFSTIYGRLKDPGLTSEDCKILLENYYRNFSNVVVLPIGTYPSTKWVRNSNNIYLSLKVDSRNGRIIILSVIDNLLKGQAGQAYQSLNLISGLPINNELDLKNFYP